MDFNQKNAWEQEYKKSQLITKDLKPQKFFLRGLKYFRRKLGFEYKGSHVLDLGSGTGRNLIYLATKGSICTGIEFSKTALDISRENSKDKDVEVKFIHQSIGESYTFEDHYFDLILDLTSSNSLNEKERDIYLAEVNRVLKSDGIFFVRVLCKEGDKNAKNLVKKFPGKEYDTYIHPDLGLQERVFDKDDFIKIYSKYFKILKLEKDTGYTRMNQQNYKRNFWIAYLIKK